MTLHMRQVHDYLTKDHSPELICNVIILIVRSWITTRSNAQTRGPEMLSATGLRRSELASNSVRLVRHVGKQVLVIDHDNRLFAIANRCPHQGYPLSEGTLGSECVLTCNWHN
jgi:Rieske [2Fe-2S] domain